MIQLQKKYYTGMQIHDVICECLSDYDTIMKMFSKFAELPSSDVERKAGEWIEDGYYNLPTVCSYCGTEGKREWKFCPNCGAEMTEGDNT